jgi:hypothetical protein
MTTGAIHECSAHCYNTEVIRQQVTLEVESIDRMYLNVYQTRRDQPALMACTIRGKTGGTRALCRGNRLSRTRYTFHGDNPSTFTAELAVCRVFTRYCQELWIGGAWLGGFLPIFLVFTAFDLNTINERNTGTHQG